MTMTTTQADVVAHVIAILDDVGLEYMVTGSFDSNARLDWAYIERWAEALGIDELVARLRRGAPFIGA